METYGGVEVWFHTFLTSSSDRTGKGESPTSGCVGPRNGLDAVEENIHERNLDSPVVQSVA
jgi:hypothetical protein